MTVRENQLNQTFVEFADTLVNDFDVPELLHSLVGRCVELFDFNAAGIMLADERQTLRVVASSNEQARMLELFEIQSHEGPCTDCYTSGETVIEKDLERSLQWPRFREEALGAGFRAVMAVPMALRHNVIGALNLFRSRPGRVDTDDRTACRALADVATIALIQERAVREAELLSEQLKLALNRRVVIEQAKGVLSAHSNGDMDTAFRALRNYARAENLALADVARAVVEGLIPPAALDRRRH